MENALKNLDPLIHLAHRFGATQTAVIHARQVPQNKLLANLCLDNKCAFYGQSFSCPPHVSGPEGFKKLQKQTRYALVIRFDIPKAVMFSDERCEVMGLLHETVAAVEEKAMEMGYPASKGFAGGSCKEIFCSEHARCRKLSGEGDCRNPHLARPSMSGFCIDVGKMLKIAGCSPKSGHADSDSEPMTWVAGLVMVG